MGDDDPVPVDTQLQRLTASADRLAALREEISAEESRRNNLITDIRDAGLTWGKVAHAGRLSISRCVDIVNGRT